MRMLIVDIQKVFKIDPTDKTEYKHMFWVFIKIAS